MAVELDAAFAQPDDALGEGLTAGAMLGVEIWMGNDDQYGVGNERWCCCLDKGSRQKRQAALKASWPERGLCKE